MPRLVRESAAPTPLDEALSGESLESSPWVQARIKELRLEGTKVAYWTPPVIEWVAVRAEERLTA